MRNNKLRVNPSMTLISPRLSEGIESHYEDEEANTRREAEKQKMQCGLLTKAKASFVLYIYSFIETAFVVIYLFFYIEYIDGPKQGKLVVVTGLRKREKKPIRT